MSRPWNPPPPLRAAAAGHFLTTPDANAAALWQLLPEETPKNELWAGWTRVLKVGAAALVEPEPEHGVAAAAWRGGWCARLWHGGAVLSMAAGRLMTCLAWLPRHRRFHCVCGVSC